MANEKTKRELRQEERAKEKLAKMAADAVKKATRDQVKAEKARAKAEREEKAAARQSGWLADPSKTWLSVDCATTAGYAIWDGANPAEAGVIKPLQVSNNKPWDKFVRIAERPTGHVQAVFPNEESAWQSIAEGLRFDNEGRLAVLADPPAYVMFEHTFAFKNQKTTTALDRRRGAVNAYLGINRGDALAFEVTVPTWHKLIGDDFGVVWPPPAGKSAKDQELRRAMIKRKSIETVTKHFGLTLSDDAAEAVLQGHYFIRVYFPAGISGSVKA